MPSTSKKQRALMQLAEHDPAAVNPPNRGVLKMSRGQLHDFAATTNYQLSKTGAKPKRGGK